MAKAKRKRSKYHVQGPSPWGHSKPTPTRRSPKTKRLFVALLRGLLMDVENTLAAAQEWSEKYEEVEFELGEITFEHWGRKYRIVAEEITPMK